MLFPSPAFCVLPGNLSIRKYNFLTSRKGIRFLCKWHGHFLLRKYFRPVSSQSGPHTVIIIVDIIAIPVDPAIIIHFGRIIAIVARRAEPPHNLIPYIFSGHSVPKQLSSCLLRKPVSISVHIVSVKYTDFLLQLMQNIIASLL